MEAVERKSHWVEFWDKAELTVSRTMIVDRTMRTKILNSSGTRL
jgi:hypothetical protein